MPQAIDFQCSIPFYTSADITLHNRQFERLREPQIPQIFRLLVVLLDTAFHCSGGKHGLKTIWKIICISKENSRKKQLQINIAFCCGKV
jgi:hypothetical protein